MAKNSLEEQKERELIKKSKSDPNAFGEIYEHYHKDIHRFIKYRVSNTEAAQDVTATVFHKALKGIHNFKWQGISFSAWLYRIARNTVIDYYRSQNKHTGNVAIEDIKIASQAKTPEEKYIETEFEVTIKELIAELPDREQKIIYMKFFEGYTNKTIAELVDLSESNVGTILHRAMKKLKKRLS